MDAIGALAAARPSLPGCPRMTGKGAFRETSRVCPGSPSRGAHPEPEKQPHLHKSCGSKGRGGSGSQSSRSVSSPSSSSSSSESSSSSSSSSSWPPVWPWGSAESPEGPSHPHSQLRVTPGCAPAARPGQGLITMSAQPTWGRREPGHTEHEVLMEGTPVFLPGKPHGQRSLGGMSMGSQRVEHD